ncbi:MAG: hypothetical protein ACYCZX_20185 [Rhodospirillaceae bacterium]
MARFSKQTMAAHLEKQMRILETRRGFKEGDGWQAVEGKSMEVIVDFGRYCEARDLLEDIQSGL